MLLLLTGSVCSGKTTIAHRCATVERLVVHDFDEVGVPEDADASWRQRTQELWAERAIAYEDAGRDLLLSGQSPLGEALAVPTAPLMGRISACLLDVSDTERLRRLDERDPGKWTTADKQDFLAWAAWHRGHAADPTYRPEVITADGWPHMLWDRWSDWQAGDPRWQVEIIDTTDKSLDECVAAVRAWIDAARHPNREG